MIRRHRWHVFIPYIDKYYTNIVNVYWRVYCIVEILKVTKI